MVEKQKNGAETYLFRYFDENGIEPSGGEQQKMAIARALAKNSTTSQFRPMTDRT